MVKKKFRILGLFVFVGLTALGIKFFVNQKPTLKTSAVYKILSEADLHESVAQKFIKLSKLDKDSGFIHVAYRWQVDGITSKFFKGIDKLFILELDIGKLKLHGVTVKPESNKPGGTIFPHLYGKQKIPMKLVREVIAL